jgi:hypothetical protein
MVYADNVNILSGSVHTIKKNKETLVAAFKEIGLETNADIAKYTPMSREENAGQSQNIKSCNSSFERVEDFKS